MKNWDCPHICDMKDCSFCPLVLEPSPDIDLTVRPMMEYQRAELNRKLVKVGYGDEYYDSIKKAAGRVQEQLNTGYLPYLDLCRLTGNKPLNYINGQLI